MLIPLAFAETAMSPSNTVTTAIPQALLLLGFISVFYFLIWRPQAKRQQEKQALLTALRAGDVIYTNGGIIGKIVQLHPDFCQIEVAANIRFYIQKEAIMHLVPKGSLKTLGFE